jgi:class 3 adenylate cyclase
MKCPRCEHDNPRGARFCEECETPLACAHPVAAAAGAPSRSPDSYTPKHLAEKILTSKAALEGERKLVTVLFADLKGSMELLADRDPEEARKILDPVLELMMEAVHRYEGTVNQVMGARTRTIVSARATRRACSSGRSRRRPSSAAHTR